MAEILSIVGAGRVGKALGRCLHELGWRVGVVVTRSIPTARAAVRAIGAGQPTDRLTCQLLASDVVLMATPDGVISGVAADLAHLGGHDWHGCVRPRPGPPGGRDPPADGAGFHTQTSGARPIATYAPDVG